MRTGSLKKLVRQPTFFTRETTLSYGCDVLITIIFENAVN